MLERHRPQGQPRLEDSAFLFLVAGTFFMEQLDGTILVTALPNIAQSFQVPPIQLDLGVSAYLITLAIVIPASGWIADRWGGRRIFIGAIATFILASVLCGLSQNVWQFVASRALQGVGGATMVPVGRLIVLRGTDKANLMRAVAYLTWPALTAPLIGPPLGGFIATYASWRWIFFINAPLGVVALLCAFRLVPRGEPARRRRFDGLGFLLTASTTVSVLYGLETIGRAGVSIATTIGLLGAGAMLGALAVRHARRVDDPLVGLETFSIRTFALVMRGGSFFRVAIGGLPFILPLLFQVGFGIDAVTSGELLLAMFAGNLAIKPATTPIISALSFRTTMIVSALGIVATIGCCALLTGATPIWVIAALMFALGVVRSLELTALNTLLFADVPQPQMGAANTIFSVQLQAANACGIAVAAASTRLSALASGAGDHGVADFRVAVIVLMVVGALSLVDFLRAPRGAGAHLTRR